MIGVIVTTGIHCRLTEGSLNAFASFCASSLKYGRVAVHLLWNEVLTVAFKLEKHMFPHYLLGNRRVLTLLNYL